MDLYGEKSKSIPQKITMVFLELLMLWLVYRILFQQAGDFLYASMNIAVTTGNYARRIIIFTCCIVVFARLSFMMFFLLKRKIPWEESISVPFAFALYYIGFSLLAYGTAIPIDFIDYLGIFIFLLGSFLNTCSELQRHFWKQKPENKDDIYTKGLFGYSMHINYFGDLLWVSAMAMLTRNPYSVVVPVFLFCFFAFYNIPKLDAYLHEKYKSQFEGYKKETKKFIPFLY